MQKNTLKLYCFVDGYNLPDLSKLDKYINVIYRNYNNPYHLDTIIKLKKFCKKNKNKFFLSNNFKLAVKFSLDGVYIPSFNKCISCVGKYSLHKNFKIIGSAHNISEVNLKIKQKCEEIFLSPIFKVNKSKKFLGICKFNMITINKKTNFIALGGISEDNYKMIKLTNSKGLASISWAKKNGLRKISGRFKFNNSFN